MGLFGSSEKSINIDHAGRMARISCLLGIVSLGSVFAVPVVMPFIFGGISITLAFLSKGYNIDSMNREAKKGILFSSISIAINIFLAITSAIVIYMALTNPEFRHQLDQLLMSEYGMTMKQLVGF